MAGRTEWRVRTRFREFVLRIGPAEHDEVPTDSAPLISELLLELGSRNAEVARAVARIRQDVRGFDGPSPGFDSGLSAFLADRDAGAFARDLEDAVRRGALVIENLPPLPLREGLDLGQLEAFVPPSTSTPAEDSETTFIGVQLRDKNGRLMPSRFRLLLPDGGVREGETGPDARIFVDGIVKGGMATLVLPEFGEPDVPIDPDEPADVASYIVNLVDEAGRSLDEVDLFISIGGDATKVTSADGQARIDAALPGGARMTLANPSRARALLKKKRKEPEPDDAAAGEAAAVSMVIPEQGAPAPVAVEADTETTVVLKLPPASVSVVEIEDLFFRTASAVVMPDAGAPTATPDTAPSGSAAALATALRFAQDHPDKRLLVAGHTDTVGTKDFNQALSEDRANCALACLRGDRAAFQDICDKRHKVGDQKQILAWAARTFGFDCDPGAINDEASTLSRPVRRFQSAYNERRAQADFATAGEDLTVDGAVGPKTWGAFFDCFEEHLAGQLVDASDAGAARQHLGEIRGVLAFVDDARQSLGFGETHPVDAVGRDSVRSQANRRVEMLFFDDDDLPNLDGTPESSEVYRPGRFARVPIPVSGSSRRRLTEICLYENRDAPLAGAPFRITVGAVTQVGVAGDGFARIDVPPGVSSVRVEWGRPSDPPLTLDGGDPRFRLTVSLAGLDASDPAGAQAMLGNIGYGSELPLEIGVSQFQSDEKLAENGQLDDPTQRTLEDTHTFLANGAA
jgi:outer membrane protein OmpA-like peptidoglycan-associated protein